MNIINKLFYAIQKHKQACYLNKILEELKSNIEAHFEDETKEMKRINFNQLEKHLEEHRAFSAKIIHMIREYTGPSGDVSYELLYFLKDWGVNHILTADKEYASILVAQKN